jgi:hypothetical protein
LSSMIGATNSLLSLPALKEVFLSKHGRKGKSRGNGDDGMTANASRHGGFRGREV